MDQVEVLMEWFMELSNMMLDVGSCGCTVQVEHGGCLAPALCRTGARRQW